MTRGWCHACTSTLVWNYPILWYFSLWHQVVNDFPLINNPSGKGHKTYFCMNFSLFCNMKIIFLVWKGIFKIAELPSTQNIGCFQVRGLSPAAFFLSPMDFTDFPMECYPYCTNVMNLLIQQMVTEKKVLTWLLCTKYQTEHWWDRKGKIWANRVYIFFFVITKTNFNLLKEVF